MGGWRFVVVARSVRALAGVLGDDVGGGGFEGGGDAAADVEVEIFQRRLGDGDDEAPGCVVGWDGAWVIDDEAEADDGAGGFDGGDGGGEVVAGAADIDVVIAGGSFGMDGDLLGADAEEGGVGHVMERFGGDLEAVIAEAVDGDALGDGFERGGPDVFDADEFGDVRVGGSGEEALGRSGLADGAGDEDDDFVGEAEGFVAVVGDEEGGDAGLAGDAGKVFDEGGTGGWIECGEGFVEEEEFGLDGEGAGQADALGLAAGEFAGVAIGEGADAETIEPVGGGVAPLGAGDAVEAEGGFDIFDDGGVEEEGLLEGGGHAAAGGEGVLSHGDAVDSEVTAGWLDEELEGAKQRAFAGAVGTDDGGDFAGSDIERVDGKHGAAAAVDDEVTDGDLGLPVLVGIRWGGIVAGHR